MVENVKADGAGRGASEYGDITVDEGSRVSSDLHFDQQRMHLYVMTERKVNWTKIYRIGNWHIVRTCQDSWYEGPLHTISWNHAFKFGLPRINNLFSPPSLKVSLYKNNNV